MLGCQVFGQYMAENSRGSIINISSASAGPPLSKAFSYSVANRHSQPTKSVENLLPASRVNAIRPGFFLTEWNRKIS